jgi:Ca-activated chloride channel family protein
VASTRGSDVVLAIDNSDSMRGEKLSQAVSAAASFVRLLDPRRDQAGVVAYDGRPHTVVSLTSDWNALDQGLATIVSGNGTRLDHGVEAAAAELLGPAHRTENRSVIVLLSDGRQTQDPGAAISAAVIARSAGVQIFAVGLGADADMDLLAAVAGTESRTFFASGPETLTAIYQRIGGAVSCR